MSALSDSYFDGSYVFTNEQGFNVAVGLEMPLDPSIGRIAFLKTNWGYDENNEYYIFSREIESHKCTKEELGLTTRSGASKFMPIHESSKQALN